MMNDPTIIAASIVTVIAALVAGIVSVVNAISASSERKEARLDRKFLTEITKATDKKADTIIEKAVEIHTVTNSNLSRVTAALDVANEEIRGLQKLMAEISKNNKRVGDAVTVSNGQVSKAAETILKGIEDNTAAIEKNTSQTKPKEEEK